MQKKCKICIKNHEIIVILRQTKTAELICEGAPKVARWHKLFAKEIIKTGKVSGYNDIGQVMFEKIQAKEFTNQI